MNYSLEDNPMPGRQAMRERHWRHVILAYKIQVCTKRILPDRYPPTTSIPITLHHTRASSALFQPASMSSGKRFPQVVTLLLVASLTRNRSWNFFSTVSLLLSGRRVGGSPLMPPHGAADGTENGDPWKRSPACWGKGARRLARMTRSPLEWANPPFPPPGQFQSVPAARLRKAQFTKQNPKIYRHTEMTFTQYGWFLLILIRLLTSDVGTLEKRNSAMCTNRRADNACEWDKRHIAIQVNVIFPYITSCPEQFDGSATKVGIQAEKPTT